MNNKIKIDLAALVALTCVNLDTQAMPTSCWPFCFPIASKSSEQRTSDRVNADLNEIDASNPAGAFVKHFEGLPDEEFKKLQEKHGECCDALQPYLALEGEALIKSDNLNTILKILKQHNMLLLYVTTKEQYAHLREPILGSLDCACKKDLEPFLALDAEKLTDFDNVRKIVDTLIEYQRPLEKVVSGEQYEWLNKPVGQELERRLLRAFERFENRSITKTQATQEIYSLLCIGVDPNANKHRDGHGPLYFAADYDLVGVVRMLIERNADVNKTTKGSHWTALHYAARRGSVAIARMLIDGGANIDLKNSMGITPFYMAAYCGNSDVSKLLVSEKADPYVIDKGGDNIMHAAAHGGDTDLIYMLAKNSKININLKNKKGETPLALAVERSHVKAVDALLENGAKVYTVDQFGNTPLNNILCNWKHYGEDEKCIQIANKLLDYDTTRKHYNKKNEDGVTPLHGAAQQGYTQVVLKLLARGADVNAKVHRKKSTPLHYAVQEGRTEIVKLLLDFGAKIDATYFVQGVAYTALHLAAAEGHPKTVATLLDYGADVFATASNGDTPLHVALKQPDVCEEVVNALLELGAGYPH